MANFWANPNDLPEGDPRREVNRSPKYWDRKENKHRDAKNKDIDVPNQQGNDGNSSWWNKPDSSNRNPRKK